MKRAKRRRTRYSSVLAYAGAAIVFLTFVLKEGVAENFKDSVATLEQAQTVFGLRREIERLRLLIFSVAGTSVSGPATTIQPVRFANIGHQFVEGDLDTMGQLLDRVGAGSDLRQRFDTYRQDMLQDGNYYKEMEDELYGRNGKKKSLDEINEEISERMPISNKLNAMEQQLEKDVINTAREKRDRHERYYEMSKRASYGLYTIGLILGLVGKISDVPIAESAD